MTQKGWAACALAAAWLLVSLLTGCVGTARPPLEIHRYALEYPAPAFKEKQPLNVAIRINDFEMARSFKSRGMVYRTKAFLYGEDAYNRWRVPPSEMISDLFARDLRNCGLYQGVFSSNDGENTRYQLSGYIDEFYEMEEGGGSRAVLALTVSLIDTARPERTGRTIFQKAYRSVQKMEKKGADPFARAMSRGLESTSSEIILDVHQAIQRHLRSK